ASANGTQRARRRSVVNRYFGLRVAVGIGLAGAPLGSFILRLVVGRAMPCCRGHANDAFALLSAGPGCRDSGYAAMVSSIHPRPSVRDLELRPSEATRH